MPEREEKLLSLAEFAVAISEMADRGDCARLGVAVRMMAMYVKSGGARLRRPPIVHVFLADDELVYRLNEEAR